MAQLPHRPWPRIETAAESQDYNIFFVFTKNVDFISLIKSDISQSSRHKCRKCPSMHMAHCPTWQEISRFQMSDSIFGQTNLAIRGRSLTTLTSFWSFLITYLPQVDICEEILLLLYRKICICWHFQYYLPTSSSQRSF